MSLPGRDRLGAAREALQAGQGFGQVDPAKPQADMVARLAEAGAGQEQDAFGLDQLGRKSVGVPAAEAAGHGQRRVSH